MFCFFNSFIFSTPSASNNLIGVKEITTIFKTKRSQTHTFERHVCIVFHWFYNAFEICVTCPRTNTNPKNITTPMKNNENESLKTMLLGVCFLNLVVISLTPVRLWLAEGLKQLKV